MITLTSGNLLRAPVEALVNTVNTVGVMGKGIALQFARAYPLMYQDYMEACGASRVKLGKMYVHDLGGLADGPRYIINFPTKGHWRAKSRLSDIEAGLNDLVRVVKELGIRSLAVPPLGCGHGGLDWVAVRPLIERAFANMRDLDVQVFEPKGAPVATDMPVATERPRMTRGNAVLLKLVDRYQRNLIDPLVTLLVAQKLMYFMQEAGQPLRLRFSQGKYGPYAENLRHQLNRLEGHYLIGYGDGEETPTKMLDLLPDAVDQADSYLARADDVNKRLDRVGRLVDGFADHFGMELLASVHWAMVQEPAARADPAAATAYVHGWSARKRAIMSDEQIAAAWTKLVSDDWQFDSVSIAVGDR